MKLPISALPLPARENILAHNLTPDPRTPSPTALKEIVKQNPSVQRRARLLDSSAHFSHLTPLTIRFPYHIKPPEDQEDYDKTALVEGWLSNYEATEEQTLAPTPQPGKLKKYSNSSREMTRELLALSDTGLQDCVPHLAVGDAYTQIGTPSLTATDEEPIRKTSGEHVAIRQELVDVLSGHSVLMSSESDSDTPYAPWSLRYSGHQFGVWAGQLGDGRAISVLETPHPSDPTLTYELQLKGAGRTPYSRTADGLAVLRSSIREYLCAEAMHALHIPTTRSLTLVHLPDLPVVREVPETACVLTRMAPSFIRIGSFEALNPPSNIYFIGGGQQDANYEALRILGEWVSKNVLKLELKENEPWGKKLVFEVARRNALMLAGWQAYGFMHGVMNTDNISVLGLTIDYGPYAFMDIYDPLHICNHSDGEGRYAFKFQPTMIIYALRALLSSLSEVIGAESESGRAIGPGWAANASSDKLKSWKLEGKELEDELRTETVKVFSDAYWDLMCKRLGIKQRATDDEDEIIRPLLDLMQTHKLDYHSTLRKLCFFEPAILQGGSDPKSRSNTSDLENFIKDLVATAEENDSGQAAKDWLAWLDKFGARLEKEEKEGLWVGSKGGRQVEAKLANPRFVLRQWVLEEIIKRVQVDPSSGKRALTKVHQMVVNPYDPWGAEGDDDGGDLPKEIREERRFCGLGAKRFLGFQCSCSS